MELHKWLDNDKKQNSFRLSPDKGHQVWKKALHMNVQNKDPDTQMLSSTILSNIHYQNCCEVDWEFCSQCLKSLHHMYKWPVSLSYYFQKWLGWNLLSSGSEKWRHVQQLLSTIAVRSSRFAYTVKVACEII